MKEIIKVWSVYKKYLVAKKKKDDEESQREYQEHKKTHEGMTLDELLLCPCKRMIIPIKTDEWVRTDVGKFLDWVEENLKD